MQSGEFATTGLSTNPASTLLILLPRLLLLLLRRFLRIPRLSLLTGTTDVNVMQFSTESK